MLKSLRDFRDISADLLPSKRSKASAFAVLIFLAGLAFLTFHRAGDAQYVLIIDSGSTGTRIVAYKWQQGPGHPPLLTAISPGTAQQKVPRRAAGDVRAYERVETEPGLDKFVEDARGVWTRALQPLLAWAEAVVPNKHWASTPLFLFGTAGLRVLSPDSQTKLLGNVCTALQASAFRFEPDWARVISGIDEGIYGWMALNYLTGHLTSDADTHEQAVNLTLLGRNYSLYTHVHHTYGLNDAFDRSVAYLLSAQISAHTQHQDSNTEALLEDSVQKKPLDQGDTVNTVPAMAGTDTGASTGGRQVLNTATNTAGRDAGADAGRRQVLNTATNTAGRDTELHTGRRKALQQNADMHGPEGTVLGDQGNSEASGRGLLQDNITVEHPCLHQGYSREYTWVAHGAHVAPLPLVQLHGRPDWAACQAVAAAVVNASQTCPSPGACALGAIQPLTSQRMYALTGFYVVYRFFHLPPTASLADLQAAGRHFCNTSWSSVTADRGAEIHVDRYCFRVPYIIQLLTVGLGFPETQISIGSGKEAWTLGAALAEGSRVLDQFQSIKSTPISGGLMQQQPLMWAALAIFATLSLALLIYVCWCQQQLQDVSNSSVDKASSIYSTPEYRSRRKSISGPAVSQEKLSLRVPSPSPFSSSMEPVTAFQTGNFGAKFSPPPLRDQVSRQHSQHRQASITRMPSLASGGHRKRQLSFGSLDSLNTG